MLESIIKLLAFIVPFLAVLTVLAALADHVLQPWLEKRRASV